MAIDIPTLAIELDTDPTGLGYAPFIADGDTTSLAEIQNLRRASIPTDVIALPTKEAQKAVVGTEYLALSAAQRDLWDILISSAAVGDDIPLDDTNIRDQLIQIWVGGTTTRTNLLALQTRNGSRIEELFATNDVVTHEQEAEALLLI